MSHRPQVNLKRGRGQAEGRNISGTSSSDDSASPRRFGIGPITRRFIPPAYATHESPTLFILGEDDARRVRSGPTRVLRDFTIYDALDSNNRVSLETFRSADMGQEYRAAGDAYASNNDLEDDEDDDPLEEDLGQNVTTTRILEVKKKREKNGRWRVLVKTRYAWYGLESPSRDYKIYDDAFRKPAHKTHSRRRETASDSDDDPSGQQKPIHMMPLTGCLAQKMFHAKFKIHGDPPLSTMIDHDPDRMRKAASELMKRESEGRGGSIVTSGQTNQYGIAQEINIAEIGTFKIGDFALVTPQEPDGTAWFQSRNKIANKYSFMRIHRIVHERGGWKVHGQFLVPACRTILQEVAHSRELFFYDYCGQDYRAGVLKGLVDVTIVRPEDDFVEPVDGQCSSLSYFVRYSIGHDGSFHALPRWTSLVRPNWDFSCVCFDDLAYKRDHEDQSQLYKPAESPHMSPFELRYRDSVYCERDFVYFGRGLFRIGQVVRLGHWTVLVDEYARHEDLVRQEGTGEFLDAHRLYKTNRRVEVSTEDLISVCHVRHEDDLPEDIRDQWTSIDGWILCHQLDPAKPEESASLSSLVPLPRAQFRPPFRATTEKECKRMNDFNEFNTGERKLWDLYCGAGGLSQGFSNIGWDVAGGLDLDPDACSTMRAYHPNAQFGFKNMDARVVLKEMLSDWDEDNPFPVPGDIDVLTSGPPCQDFSGLNLFKAKDDSKRALITVPVTVAEYLKPNYFVLENVPLVLQSSLKGEDGGKEVKHGAHKFLLRALTSLGWAPYYTITPMPLSNRTYPASYNVRWRKYQAAQFGAPQNRERLIYMAARRHLVLPSVIPPTHFPLIPGTDQPLPIQSANIPNFPVFDLRQVRVLGAPHRAISARDAIADLCAFDWKLPSENDRTHKEVPLPWPDHLGRPPHIPKVSSQVASRAASMEEKGFVMSYACPPSNTFQQRIRAGLDAPTLHITREFTNINIERIHWIGWGPNSDHRALPEKLQLPGLNSTASAGAFKHNYFKGLYGRLMWDSFFQTVVTRIAPGNKQGRCLHPNQKRVLSVRECARAQGFLDSMHFHSDDGDPVDMHRQIGNAVPIPLSEALARELRRSILFPDTDVQEHIKQEAGRIQRDEM
ncbi:hypothetical protein FRB97_007243 [Tulasnella sp. 331]|nr:hypothetical protein FRB97_007243 [Tulasnella sp. 331]